MNFPWPKERKASRTDKMQNLSADSVRSSSQSSPNSLKRSTALAFETSAVLNPIGSDGSTAKASLDSDLRQSNSNMLPAVVQQLIATVSTADARHCFKPMNKLKFDETEIDLGSWEKPLQKVQHPKNETAKVSPQTNCSQSLSKPGHGEDCPGWLPWLSSDKKVGIVGQRWQTCPVSAKACARASKEQVGPSCTPASCQKHHCQIGTHHMILQCLAYHIAVRHCMTAFPSFSLYTQPLLQLREKSMRGTKRTGWRSRWRWRLPQRCWDERKGATNSNELLDIAGRSGRPIDCGPIMAHLSPRNNSRSGKRGDLWQCQGHRATRVPTPLLLVFPQCSWPEKTANDFDMLQFVNCIQLPGCGHQTRSPLSSCRLPAAVISVQSEGFEQRESAAFTWPLLSFVHIYPLFQAGMGSFQTRWSAGPCGTMTFPARQCLHASSAHAHATVASRSTAGCHLMLFECFECWCSPMNLGGKMASSCFQWRLAMMAGNSTCLVLTSAVACFCPLRLGLLSAVAEWQPQSQRAQRTKVAVLRDLRVWVTTTDSSTQQIRPSHRATGLAKVGTKWSTPAWKRHLSAACRRLLA